MGSGDDGHSAERRTARRSGIKPYQRKVIVGRMVSHGNVQWQFGGCVQGDGG